jgi:hypothetical protein
MLARPCVREGESLTSGAAIFFASLSRRLGGQGRVGVQAPACARLTVVYFFLFFFLFFFCFFAFADC